MFVTKLENGEICTRRSLSWFLWAKHWDSCGEVSTQQLCPQYKYTRYSGNFLLVLKDIHWKIKQWLIFLNCELCLLVRNPCWWCCLTSPGNDTIYLLHPAPSHRHCWGSSAEALKGRYSIVRTRKYYGSVHQQCQGLCKIYRQSQEKVLYKHPLWLPATVQRHGRLTGDFNWPLMGGRSGVYSKNVFDGHLDI